MDHFYLGELLDHIIVNSFFAWFQLFLSLARGLWYHVWCLWLKSFVFRNKSVQANVLFSLMTILNCQLVYWMIEWFIEWLNGLFNDWMAYWLFIGLLNDRCNHVFTSAQHLPNQSSVFNENLTRHFMFQHCQPMRNHDTEQLQEEIEK